jgi:uncharacterized protein (TIGR03067 family)
MTRATFGFALGLSLLLGSVQAADDDVIKGTWKFTSINAGGVPVPEQVTKTLELKLSKDELVLSGSALNETIKSRVSLDEKVRNFDFEPTTGPEKGKVSKGVYELSVAKGDGGEKVTMRIYFAKPGGERPKKLEEEVADGHFLWVLEKSK